jgi:hypothetical protein
VTRRQAQATSKSRGHVVHPSLDRARQALVKGESMLRVQQVTQIYTITNCCVVDFCTWVLTARRRVNAPTELWRGMKDLALTAEFVQNGGTEFGCMSTSTSKETVAA